MNRSTEYKMEGKKDFGKEKIELLYEDSALAVIYKPSGMLSVPYPGSHNKTAEAALEEILRKKGTYSKNHKPLPVHRLDRDTSGVMMFAMSEQAQKKIMENWQTMVKSRLYRAVAENPENPEMILPDRGTIDEGLAYNAHNIGFVPREDDKPADKKYPSHSSKEKSIHEKSLQVKNGKLSFKTISAVTHFKVLLRGKKYTLFELSLDTGRKNQIRAHLSYKGYTLCGDENYRAKTNPFNRLALHARTLEFVHPYSGELLKFERPEPEDWAVCVEKGLEKEYQAVWNQEQKKSSKDSAKKRDEAAGKSVKSGKSGKSGKAGPSVKTGASGKGGQTAGKAGKNDSYDSFEKAAKKAQELSAKKKNATDFISRGKLKQKK